MSSLGRLERLAYRAQQLSFLLNATVMQTTAARLARHKRPGLPKHVETMLQQRYRELLDRDLQNVDDGYYGRELLFQIPFAEYLRAFPKLLRDAPKTVRRMKKRDFKDLPDIDLSHYPAYYRRNFHWQTDGYFSEHSAEIYDLGVEMLFRGTADVMRRQIIPPVTRFLRGSAQAKARILDIACGTGRTIKQLAATHPTMRFHGVDLSPFYIKAARKRLADVGEVSLVVENAEQLPYVDGYFDVVTSVHLFHELPRRVRRRVLDEAYRVLRPGGLLVLEDSCQVSDSGEIATVLGAFPEEFHEPYYAEYLDDDLGDVAVECGFEVDRVEAHMVAKVVVARKPLL
jgi:ubiquinone/menaquinone biosynthesis C-methylase UbiE